MNPEDPVGTSVAVEVARLTGRIDQVIVDHERRLAVLETRIITGGARTAAIAGPWIAGAGILLVIVFKVPWI